LEGGNAEDRIEGGCEKEGIVYQKIGKIALLQKNHSQIFLVVLTVREYFLFGERSTLTRRSRNNVKEYY